MAAPTATPAAEGRYRDWPRSSPEGAGFGTGELVWMEEMVSNVEKALSSKVLLDKVGSVKWAEVFGDSIYEADEIPPLPLIVTEDLFGVLIQPTRYHDHFRTISAYPTFLKVSVMERKIKRQDLENEMSKLASAAPTALSAIIRSWKLEEKLSERLAFPIPKKQESETLDACRDEIYAEATSFVTNNNGKSDIWTRHLNQQRSTVWRDPTAFFPTSTPDIVPKCALPSSTSSSSVLETPVKTRLGHYQAARLAGLVKLDRPVRDPLPTSTSMEVLPPTSPTPAAGFGLPFSIAPRAALRALPTTAITSSSSSASEAGTRQLITRSNRTPTETVLNVPLQPSISSSTTAAATEAMPRMRAPLPEREPPARYTSGSASSSAAVLPPQRPRTRRLASHLPGVHLPTTAVADPPASSQIPGPQSSSTATKSVIGAEIRQPHLRSVSRAHGLDERKPILEPLTHPRPSTSINPAVSNPEPASAGTSARTTGTAFIELGTAARSSSARDKIFIGLDVNTGGRALDTIGETGEIPEREMGNDETSSEGAKDVVNLIGPGEVVGTDELAEEGGIPMDLTEAGGAAAGDTDPAVVKEDVTAARFHSTDDKPSAAPVKSDVSTTETTLKRRERAATVEHSRQTSGNPAATKKPREGRTSYALGTLLDMEHTDVAKMSDHEEVEDILLSALRELRRLNDEVKEEQTAKETLDRQCETLWRGHRARQDMMIKKRGKKDEDEPEDLGSGDPDATPRASSRNRLA